MNSAACLTEFLKDTEWEWGDGLRLRADGAAENPGWPGQATRWEAVDRRTVVLVLEAGREKDRYAVLTFREDLSAFHGFDFESARRLDPPAQRKK